MPIYQYKCKNEKCENHKGFEKIHFKVKDPKLTKCPVCKAELESMMSAPNIRFIGSGFYSTDYKNKVEERKKKREEKFKTKTDDKKKD